MTNLMNRKPKRWLRNYWLKIVMVLLVVGTTVYLGSLINKILDSPLRNYLDEILIIFFNHPWEVYSTV